jgi:5-methylcytosine-specific restriction endonuclease McrBC regulatory subunit McrC
MLTIDLHERDARLIPRVDVVDSDGRSLILPETRDLKAIELRDVTDGVQLRATGLIGYLPLTTDITLNIRPKFPLSNLWYMLDHAEELFDRVLPVIRRYERTGERAPHLLLARAFCFYLSEILSSSIIRAYPRARREHYYQPKVDFGATMSRFISRGDSLRTVSDIFDFSRDVKANRLLKAACLQFTKLVPRSADWSQEREILNDALARLASIDPQYIQQFDLNAADTVPMRIRNAYKGALSIYALQAGLTGIGFTFEASGSELPSFLFNLDDVFEAFVRNRLRTLLRSSYISIADGNKPEHHGVLFKDSRRYPTKPDLIFKLYRNVLALGEVKYKPRIEEGDRYQLISHTIAAGTTRAFWISPAATPADAGLDYVGSINSGAAFYHYRLDISGDLERTSEDMAQAIKNLLIPTQQNPVLQPA